MDSSAFASFLFTLSLVLISQTASGANFVEDLCNQVGEDSARCLQVLKANPKIASAKNDIQLCKSVLETGLKKAIAGQNYLKEVMKTNPVPAITECATVHYNGVVGSFKSSLGEIKEDGMTANYDAKVAGDGPETCDRGLAAAKINNPAITALNSEILLLSKIAFFATNKLPDSA